MKIYYDNLLNVSTMNVYAKSEDSSYPAQNVLDSRLSRVYRSTAVQAVEEILFLNVPTASTGETYISFVNHNISSSVTIWGSFVASTVWGSTSLVAQQLTFEWSTYSIIALWSTGGFSASARFKIWIYGNSTDNDYTEIGSIMANRSFGMPYMKPDQTLSRGVNSRITIGDSGQAYGDNGYDYRNPKINFPYISSQERVDMSSMFINSKNYKPMIVDIWQSSNSNEDEEMYCIIDQNELEFKRTDDVNYRWATSLKFREVF